LEVLVKINLLLFVKIKMKKGIIFDFDGVLVDSVESLFGLYFTVCSEFSANVDESDLDFLNGKNIDEICHFIVSKYAIRKKQEYVKSIYHENLIDIYAGMVIEAKWIEIFTSLKANGIEFSIASGCDTELINIVLNEHNIVDLFSAVVGGDMVSKSKPNPDIILKCLSDSGWSSAVVLDDSNNGIKAALAADCCAIKYDVKARGDILGLIIKSLNNNFSYLGSIDNLNFDLLESNNKPYTAEEEKKWRKLLDNGCYNNTVYKSDIKNDFNIDNIKIYKSDYKEFRIKNNNPIFAVTGVVINHSNNVLCAKRSVLNYQNVNEYDLVPSGSLEKLDVVAQLTEEWQEETSTDILLSWGDTFSFVYDHISKVVDIVVSTSVDTLELGALFSTEVSDFQWLDVSELSDKKVSNSAEFIMAVMGDV
jgi:beta-phosphoglucomutase-like phosphatase (HAD superfamily)